MSSNGGRPAESHHSHSSRDSALGTAPLPHRKSKKISGGFLLHKLRHGSNAEATSKGWRQQIPTATDSNDRVSTSSPGSARSAKSQGKAPVHGEYLEVDGSRTPDRSDSNMGRHSWAQSTSTGRESRTSQSSEVMNPNQLIQMALSLSEGRKRVASGVPTQTVIPVKRSGTVHADAATPVVAGSPLGNDTVRRRARASRDISGDFHYSPEKAHSNSTTATPPSLVGAGDDVTYDFSISCLQRAERAKKYFELSHQYRRLLASMPPLTQRGSNAVGSHQPLGREYNPLQFLRNERVRRERGVRLNPHPDDFEDVSQVTAFVAATEKVRSQHLSQDAPEHPPLPDIRYFQQQAQSPNPKQHTRSNTSSSKILWFDSPWTFTPMALLADLAWTDDWRNRWVLEDRFGAQLFPVQDSPTMSQGQSPQQDRRPKRAATFDVSNDRIEPQRGRRKRNFLSIHKIEQETAKMLHWHRGQPRNASTSDVSSVSSGETQGQLTNDGVNIGPLARHMQREMELADRESVSTEGRWDDMPQDMDWRQASQQFDRRRGSTDRDFLSNERTVTRGSRGTHSAVDSSNDFESAFEMASRNNSMLNQRRYSASEFAHSDYKQRVDERDFAAAERHRSRPSDTLDRARRSFDSTARGESSHRRSDSIDRGLRRRNTAGSADGSTKGVNKAISRIIKDSVVVGLLRKEGRRGETDHRGDLSYVPTRVSNMDEDDEAAYEDTGRTGMRHKYDAPLPSFRFPSRDGSSHDLTDTEAAKPPPLSRHPSSRVPRLQIPNSDETKQQEPEPTGSSMLSLLSPIKRIRGNRSPMHSRAPSTVGSQVSLAPRPGPPKRRWSIADGLDRAAKSTVVNARDVERVRALFLSSGIKAAQLCRQADCIPPSCGKGLAAAALAVGRAPPSIKKRDESRYAAAMWREAIATLQSDAEHQLAQWRDKKLPDMRHGIDALRHTAGEDLSTALRRAGDEADLFAAEIGGVQSLRVKECHDAIDTLLRRRRKGARMLRKIGWKSLEVFLVLIMWVLWGVFTVVRVIRGFARGVIGGTRWLIPL